MASNLRAGVPATRRCTDNGLLYGSGYAGDGPGNTNAGMEVRVEAVKLSNKAGPNKAKPHKEAMAKAGVVKDSFIGKKDGSLGVIVQPAVVPADKAQ